MKGKTDCMYCNGTGRAVPFFRANAEEDGRVACSCMKKSETAEPMKSMEYKPKIKL